MAVMSNQYVYLSLSIVLQILFAPPTTDEKVLEKIVTIGTTNALETKSIVWRPLQPYELGNICDMITFIDIM